MKIKVKDAAWLLSFKSKLKGTVREKWKRV